MVWRHSGINRLLPFAILPLLGVGWHAIITEAETPGQLKIPKNDGRGIADRPTFFGTFIFL